MLHNRRHHKPQVPFRLEDEECLFSVISTGTIRSHSKYEVVVALHRAQQACSFKISLCGTLYEDYQIIKLQPLSLRNLIFDVPKLRPGIHELRVEGLTGISYKNLNKLWVLGTKPIIIIQTDKSPYKPGDLVQFRVLVLDDDTRPYDLKEPLQISISDGEKNCLKQWKNIQLINGVFSGRYNICEEPVLGEWKIEVTVGRLSPEVKTFEVKRCILPNFKFEIVTPGDVAICEEVIEIILSSKYWYGRNVKGQATVYVRKFKRGQFCHCSKNQIIVDGEGVAVFHLANDLGIEIDDVYESKLDVIATMEERIDEIGIQTLTTMNLQNSLDFIMEERLGYIGLQPETTINLHNSLYKLELFDTKLEFEVGKLWSINIAVKYINGMPVVDQQNPVILELKMLHDVLPNSHLRNRIPVNSHIVLQATLNEQGIAAFNYTITQENVNFCMINASYLDYWKPVASGTKKCMQQNTTVLLKITVLTADAGVGDNVQVLVECSEIMPYLVYTVVGRGKILTSKFISVPKNKKEHYINLMATYEMMPEAGIFVHLVVNNKLYFAEQKIFVTRNYLSTINIKVLTENNSSEEIALQIETAPNSFVGLLGVDESAFILQDGNDLYGEVVAEKLNHFTSKTIKNYGCKTKRYPGEMFSLIMLGNIWLPMQPGSRMFQGRDNQMVRQAIGFGSEVESCAAPLPNAANLSSLDKNLVAKIFKPKPQVFPDILIFEDIKSTKEPVTDIKIKVPETIKNCDLTGFAVNPSTGLVWTKQSTMNTVRYFFLRTNLPFSIKKGEYCSLPVVLFNNRNQEVKAEIRLEHNLNEFEILGNRRRIKYVKVPAYTCAYVNFKICPKVIGIITFKISASSALDNDSIYKELSVVAEGCTRIISHDIYLGDESSIAVMRDFKFYIPRDVIPDSVNIEVKLMGIFASTINNNGYIVYSESSCSDHIMMNFLFNILALWYSERIQDIGQSIESKAKRSLEIAYQRELTFKHNDGSFSAFGKSDGCGSTWLTAFVMRFFHQAQKYIYISQSILDEGLDFLARTQNNNGSFKEVGRPADCTKNELWLTAFVLLAFLENCDAVDKHKDAIDRGFEYLQQSIQFSEDVYLLSIAMYTLQQRKIPIARETLHKFMACICHEEWWDRHYQKYRISHGYRVEIAGYLAMTALDMDIFNNNLTDIVKWLILHRTGDCFPTTIASVVGLSALMKFTEKFGTSNPKFNILICDDSALNRTGLMLIRNNLTVVSKKIPNSSRSLVYGHVGFGTDSYAGTAILRISYCYNLSRTMPSKWFELDVKANLCKILCIHITARFTPFTQEESSNLFVMKVSLPSGYKADRANLDKIRQTEGVLQVDTKGEDTLVLVYFRSFESCQPKEIFIKALPTHNVSKQKPASITISDCYMPERFAGVLYTINSV